MASAFFLYESVILIDNLENGKNYLWTILCIKIKTSEGCNEVETQQGAEGCCALAPGYTTHIVVAEAAKYSFELLIHPPYSPD